MSDSIPFNKFVIYIKYLPLISQFKSLCFNHYSKLWQTLVEIEISTEQLFVSLRTRSGFKVQGKNVV